LVALFRAHLNKVVAIALGARGAPSRWLRSW